MPDVKNQKIQKIQDFEFWQKPKIHKKYKFLKIDLFKYFIILQIIIYRNSVMFKSEYSKNQKLTIFVKNCKKFHKITKFSSKKLRFLKKSKK